MAASMRSDCASGMRLWAVPVLFVLLGVPFGSWASRIPAVRDALQLSAGQLGLVLCGGGIGAIIAFPLAAWAIVRLGVRRTVLLSGVALLLCMVGIPAAPHVFLLTAVMVCFGLCASVFDVAINMAGVAAEKSAGRSIMSMMHAWYCIGTFSGALFGSAMAALSWTPLAHFGLVGAALAWPLWLGYRALPDCRSDSGEGGRIFSVPHGALAVLGIIGFCAAIAEGSIADWSGIYLKDHLGAGEGIAPLAYAGFAAMMLCSRLVGDRLKDAFGARRVLVLGSLLSAGGVFAAVLAPNVPMAIAGFALSGAGVAVNFPFIFSAAGRYGSTAMAGVATLSYSGALIGPPAIGFVAEGMGLQAGMALIAILSMGVAAAASRASILEPVDDPIERADAPAP